MQLGINNTMNIQRLITKGESEALEFKASFGKDVIETLCVFANHQGGSVLIGVSSGVKNLHLNTFE